MTRRTRNTLALLIGLALGGIAGCATIRGVGIDLQHASEGLAGGTSEDKAAQDKYRPVAK